LLHELTDVAVMIDYADDNDDTWEDNLLTYVLTYLLTWNNDVDDSDTAALMILTMMIPGLVGLVLQVVPVFTVSLCSVSYSDTHRP